MKTDCVLCEERVQLLYIILINVCFQRVNQTWGQNYVYINIYEEFEGITWLLCAVVT
jgi:hypothetical protein